jgi:hypothetical protein
MNFNMASFRTNTLKQKRGSPKYTNVVMTDNSIVVGV